MPSKTVDATALYAGTGVASLSSIVSAARAVRELAGITDDQADTPL
jgi:hypothetical protein